MSTERPPIDEILFGALERSGADRATYLDEVCGSETDLRVEMDSLLQAAAKSEDFLEPRTDPSVPIITRSATAVPKIGDTIDRYRLEKLVGTGGMGTVYRASRADGEFRKRVAIKLLRPGMDSGEILSRFRHERQVLASLEHPNIARLLDGGETDDGRPFLVMEFVDGVPIDRYCEERSLTVHQRLEVFRTVCDAVHHAHQNLVVHRDLKPGNILVDEHGQVKLLDFGIAKVLDAGADLTRTEDRRLTPQFASPEQIMNRPITTASDVYSLGVNLYALLSGQLPYIVESSSNRDLEEMIVETEPPKPSTLVSTGDQTAKRLARQLAGDLDNIVLKALRKEPVRRYLSVEALAEDIRRHLEGRPILARPDTVRYRVGKFVRRNPVSVGLSFALALVLILAAFINTIAAGTISALLVVFALAGVLSTSLFFRAQRAQREAERARMNAEQVTELLEDALRSIKPESAQGQDATLLRQVLDATAQRVVRELPGDSPAAASLHLTIGATYRSLGLLDLAAGYTESAVRIRRGLDGSGQASVSEALCEMGFLAFGRGAFDEAEAAFEESLQIERALGRPEQEVLGMVLFGLGEVCEAKDDVVRTEACYREALEVREQATGRASTDYVRSLAALGWFLTQQERFDEAEPLLRLAVELAEELGEETTMAAALGALGGCMKWQRRFDESEALLRRALSHDRRIYGETHIRYAERLDELASILVFKDPPDLDGAERYYHEGLAIMEKTLGRTHRTIGTALNNLGGVLHKQGRNRESETAFREAIAIYREVLGAEHSWVGISLGNLAILLSADGDAEQAVEVAEEGLRVRLANWPKSHWRIAEMKSVLGFALGRAGEADRAESLLREALADLEDMRGINHRIVAEAKRRLEAQLGRSVDSS